jgi:exopolysaccharide biosynthesis polyprenyl glycosylphosphotransferase
MEVSIMHELQVDFPDLATSASIRNRFSWKYAGRHFDDLGAIRVSLYVIFRDMIPTVLLGTFWFLQHPDTIRGFRTSWQAPQLSLWDFTLLISLTFCWQLVAGGKLATGSQLIRKQIIGNLASALCCSVMVFAAGCTHAPLMRSLTLSVWFFLASSFLGLLLLAVACISRWAVLTFVVNRREVMIIGSGPRAQKLFAELIDSPLHNVVGIVDDEFVGTPEMAAKYLGPLENLGAILRRYPVQTAFCSLPIKSMYSQSQHALSVCEEIGVEVRYLAQQFETRIGHLDAHASAHGLFAILRMVRQDSTGYAKRAMDIVGSAALLIASAPIVAAAAIAIKLTSPGPVFFAQERYGLNRKRFLIFKLRTMVIDAEQQQSKYESMNEVSGPVFKIRRDPRITRVGAFLRKTSIDELPQLWNVLRGDMSLVGPRPLAVRDVLRIEDSRHLRRFSVKPGITCLWQMSGRNNTDFETWIKQDLDYIDSWSLLLDARILLGTVPAVLWGRGAM